MAVRERIDWIDAGRGIAITLVALYHSARWLSEAGIDTSLWQEVNAGLATLRMPVFFTISGMFAGKWVRGPWSALLSRKVMFLAWVFAVWQLLGTVFFYGGNALIGKRLGLLNTLQSLLVAPVLPQLELWFIWALAWFFVAAKALSVFPEWLQLTLTGAVSAVALTLWHSQTTGPTGAAKFFFFFLAGMLLRGRLVRLSTVPAWLAAVFVLPWAGASIASVMFGFIDIPGWFFLNCLLGVVAGISVARAVTVVSAVRFLGRNTLPIYVTHTPLILTGVSLLHLVGYAGNGPDALATPVLATCAITGALGLHALLRQGALGWVYGPGESVTESTEKRLTEIFAKRRAARAARVARRHSPHLAGNGMEGAGSDAAVHGD